MHYRIAIPTDFSQHALQAARFILDLFRGDSCTFFLVHTYTPSFLRAEYLVHSPGQIGLGDFYQERVRKKLRKFEEAIKPFAGKAHEFICHSAFNNLDTELAEMGQKEKLDLIAMGTQGATGAKEVLFGTHAVQVIHRSRIPVLVIPASASFEAVKDILFPTDYAPDYSTLELTVVDRILAHPGTRLHILHAFSGSDGMQAWQRAGDQLKERFGEHTIQLTETGDKDILEAIDEFTSRQPIQLLAMVRNRHSFLENLMSRPVIDQIGLHTAIPFLVIPAPTEIRSS